MDYIKAFLIGGSHLRCSADSSGQNKADAGTGYGITRLYRRSAWIYWSIRTICKIFRSRRKRSTSGIRKCPVERCEGSC